MIFSRPSIKTVQGLGAWADRLTESLNRFHPTISRLPVFADDISAAAANLGVGNPYVTPDGFVKRRMS